MFLVFNCFLSILASVLQVLSSWLRGETGAHVSTDGRWLRQWKAFFNQGWGVRYRET